MRHALLILTLSALALGDVRADTSAALRVLRDECLGCHKPGKAKGGLLLTTREKTLAGGDNGAALVPGKSAESLLFQVLHPDAEDHMPPKKQLSETAIRALQAWIDAGAEWKAEVFDEPPPILPVKFTPIAASYQPILSLALSPDDKRVAFNRGADIFIHDLEKPERPLLQRLQGFQSPVQALAWSPDGKRLIAAGFRLILIWDSESWEQPQRIEEQLIGAPTALAVSPDGATLFAADGEAGGLGFIHQIDLAKGSVSKTWKAHDDGVNGLSLSQDGKWLASAGADKMARIWKTSDASLSASYEGHTNHLLGVAFNHDASRIATAGADREIKVWDVPTREQDAILGDKKKAFTALNWTRDGKALAAMHDKGGGSVYTDFQKHTGAQRSEGAKERKLDAINATLTSIAITQDAKTVFGGAFDGTLHLWDASNGKVLAQIAPGD